MNEKLLTLWAKVQVMLRALPTYLAAATVVLTVVATQIVPLLPEEWGLQVAAWIATALAVLAAIAEAIKRLTPVPEDQQGWGLDTKTTTITVPKDSGHVYVNGILSVLGIVLIVLIVLALL